MLVVGAGDGARGLLLANYGASTLVLLGLWWTLRHRLRARRARAGERLGALLRFGLPTVPAEASVYALSIVDRYYVYHDRSPALAGALLDRDQARRRGRLHRARVPVRVAAAGLLGHRRRRGGPALRAGDHLLRARQRLGRGRAGAARALGPAAADRPRLLRRLPGAAVGRARLGAVRAVGRVPGHRRPGEGRRRATSRPRSPGWPPTSSCSSCSVPPLGIAGAGIALCGAYVVMLAVMHLLTRGRLHGATSSGGGWPSWWSSWAAWRPPVTAPAHPRRGRVPDPAGRVRGHPGGPVPHRLRPPRRAARRLAAAAPAAPARSAPAGSEP